MVKYDIVYERFISFALPFSWDFILSLPFTTYRKPAMRQPELTHINGGTKVSVGQVSGVRLRVSTTTIVICEG